jgi:hypothetical protein
VAPPRHDLPADCEEVFRVSLGEVKSGKVGRWESKNTSMNFSERFEDLEIWKESRQSYKLTYAFTFTFFHLPAFY